MSYGDNTALLTWLDSAIAETSDLAERVVIMNLAENAGSITGPVAPRVHIEPSTAGLSVREIGTAVDRLRKRGYLEQAWMLTFPGEYQAREAA